MKILAESIAGVSKVFFSFIYLFLALDITEFLSNLIYKGFLRKIYRDSWQIFINNKHTIKLIRVILFLNFYTNTSYVCSYLYAYYINYITANILALNSLHSSHHCELFVKTFLIWRFYLSASFLWLVYILIWYWLLFRWAYDNVNSL